MAVTPERSFSVTLIVPTHGSLSTAARALRAVAALTPAPAQIVIVRDAPAESGDVEWLPDQATVVQVHYAAGPAKARNAGAAVATSDLLLFVDADVVIPAGTISQVRAEFRRHPEATAIFGSYDASPEERNFLSQYRNLLHYYVHQRAQEDAGTFWAGLGAIKAEAFHAVGGFNPAYHQPSIEDIELGTRLKEAGAEIRLVKHLQGCHLKRWTAWGVLKTDLLQRGVPWTRLILARGTAPDDLNTDLASRWSVLLAWFGLVALPLGRASVMWLFPSVLAWAGVVALNLPFYRFLVQHRGLGLALKSIPWHMIYYLECGLAGMIGLLLHCRDRMLPQPVSAP